MPVVHCSSECYYSCMVGIPILLSLNYWLIHCCIGFMNQCQGRNSSGAVAWYCFSDSPAPNLHHKPQLSNFSGFSPILFPLFILFKKINGMHLKLHFVFRLSF
ncbi:hypothetical protein RchiOBHm_Chr1g0372731 [Rosa chinensis]|uniref:Uncharacterized protein n=1 Tax=Rosa chinensis TaxID=74649 RepID=A0A2P6SLY3_ROSCH|nr:hypothetical protein RchiOBHm_Chr1g0372731 [Rosa chinensis]